MFDIEIRNSLVLVVLDGRYDIYGDPTFNNLWITRMIKKLGVAETLTPGKYRVKTTFRYFRVEISLIPA